jgi:hypothetical protein
MSVAVKDFWNDMSVRWSALAWYDKIVTDSRLVADFVWDKALFLENFSYNFSLVTDAVEDVSSFALVLDRMPLKYAVDLLDAWKEKPKVLIISMAVGCASYDHAWSPYFDDMEALSEPYVVYELDAAQWFDEVVAKYSHAAIRSSALFIPHELPSDLTMTDGWSNAVLIDQVSDTLVISPTSLLMTVGVVVQAQSDDGTPLSYIPFDTWTTPPEHIMNKLPDYRRMVVIADHDFDYIRSWVKKWWDDSKPFQVIAPLYKSVMSFLPEVVLEQAERDVEWLYQRMGGEEA